jgi:plastocyanin
MLRLASAFLAASLVLPAAATAQRAIAVGQTVNGTFTSSDPMLEDDSHYHLYTFRASAGERVTFTLRSTDFDAVLAVGRFSGAECEERCRTNDDGAGDTDARITMTFREAGEYTVRTNTFEGGELGDYTLTAERAPAAPTPVARAVTLDAPVTGELGEGDATLDRDGSYYEDWTFRAPYNGEMEIVLASEDFDTFLFFGTELGEEFSEEFSDDDGDGEDGTNSRLTVSVEAGTTYTIRANTYGESETGRYTLTLRRVD